MFVEFAPWDQPSFSACSYNYIILLLFSSAIPHGFTIRVERTVDTGTVAAASVADLGSMDSKPTPVRNPTPAPNPNPALNPTPVPNPTPAPDPTPVPNLTPVPNPTPAPDPTPAPNLPH